MTEAGRREWPLAVFTIAIQFASGLALAATWADFQVGDSAAPMRPLALAIFPLVALGILASLLHLGRPRAAWRALRNLRQSRLSLEVLLTSLFALAALGDSTMWFAGRTDLRLACGIVASFLGLAAVCSSAAIYMVPTQPSWNSWWLPTSFLGTTFLLAGLAPAVSLRSGYGEFSRAFLVSVIIGSVMLLGAGLRMLSSLRAVDRRHSWWAGIYLLLAGVVPFALALRWWAGISYAAQISDFEITLVTLTSALVGVVIGRMLMYATAASSRF